MLNTRTNHNLWDLKLANVRVNKTLKILSQLFLSLSETPRQSFFSLPNLTELSMRGAFEKKSKRVIKLSAFTNLPRLKILNISKNKIQLIEIEKKTVVFVNLEALDLSMNSLSDLKFLYNLRMPKLQLLYLQKNNLLYVNRDTFVNLTSLTAIDLQHNNLGEIPYFPSGYLLEIAFSGNGWNCTCDQLTENMDIRLVCELTSGKKIPGGLVVFLLTGSSFISGS